MPARGSDAEPGNLLGSRSLLFGFIAALLVLLYAAVFLRTPDRLFADDSYFYFQVAWNFARGKGSTFNTIMPTNGYHPLWMLVCAAVFKVLPDKRSAVHGIAAVIAALQVTTLLTVTGLTRRVAGYLWPLSFLLLLPFCFTSQLGTEGALSGMFLALLMLFGWRFSCVPTLRNAAVFNLVAALAVLSRLDDIFIVAFVWLAVGLTLPAGKRTLQLVTLPIYLVLWGAYLASNWIYFGTLQPISGLLKAHSLVDHVFGYNVPFTGRLCLAIIVVAIPLLAAFRRDRFFRAIELPFALGVLCHAAYILFRMSSETRWSWYYTSWILLSSVLVARVASVAFARRPRFAQALAAITLLGLAVIWYQRSYVTVYKGHEVRPPVAFNEAVYQRAGIHRVFAFDLPGLVTYYSDLEIVPLDGLMGNLQFQHDLATKGIVQVAREEHIDGFLGPTNPVNPQVAASICGKVFLSSVNFHCRPDGAQNFSIEAVDVYARTPSRMVGTLPLPESQIVYEWTGFITIWRLDPFALPVALQSVQ